MNYFEKLPVKTQTVNLSGNDVRIDTAGLEATLYVTDGDAYIKANSAVKNEDAFIIKNGTYFTLNGAFYIGGDNAVVRILYCRTV